VEWRKTDISQYRNNHNSTKIHHSRYQEVHFGLLSPPKTQGEKHLTTSRHRRQNAEAGPWPVSEEWNSKTGAVPQCRSLRKIGWNLQVNQAHLQKHKVGSLPGCLTKLSLSFHNPHLLFFQTNWAEKAIGELG